MNIAVGFIGSGMMASAIMDGLVAKGSSPAKISCSDPYPGTVEAAKAKGYQASTSNKDVVSRTNDAIVIAVKPDYVLTVCKDIAEVQSDALIISVAAGVTLATLEEALPGRRVVRVMPNTACLIGESASGFALGALANSQDKTLVETIFGSVGIALEQPNEDLLNAVTGLSGSGPAYVFQFIEAMADGGVRVGLHRDVAVKLAAQTVKGAAQMVLSTGRNPADLKNQVCSAKGTTIAGVDALENGGLRPTVINAVKAATRRSLQLAGKSEQEIASEYNL